MLRILCRYYTKDYALVNNSTKRDIFDMEYKRQIQCSRNNSEEITVICHTDTGKITLTMERNISTPMDCVKIINNANIKQSVIAFVNNKLYDLNRQLTENSSISFTNFRSINNFQPNIALWRSCSFLTNWFLKSYIQEDFTLNFCSFPFPDLRSGSFVCDVQLLHRNDPLFNPELLKTINLKSISDIAGEIIEKPYRFKILNASMKVALDIFHDSPIKLKQIPLIMKREQIRLGKDSLTLYKIGDHIDICQGPLIPCTSIIGQFKLVTIYPIDTYDYGRLYRIQGIAIPKQMPHLINYFNKMTKNAKTHNLSAPLPSLGSTANLKSSVT